MSRWLGLSSQFAKFDTELRVLAGPLRELTRVYFSRPAAEMRRAPMRNGRRRRDAVLRLLIRAYPHFVSNK